MRPGTTPSWRDLEPALELVGEPVEQRGQLLLLYVIRLMSCDGHTGQIVSKVGQFDRPQIGMLDVPPVTLRRTDCHAQRDAIAFPRHDNRVQAPLPGSVFL